MDRKQHTRNEIRENHINKLQQKYNSIYKEYKELQDKYSMLSHFAIETVFSEFNDDVELLARCLYRQGLINRTETEYINPIKDDDNYLSYKKIDIVEEQNNGN